MTDNNPEPTFKSDIHYSSDVIVGSIVLTSHNGVEVDIAPLVREFNIYESIFENTLTGDIIIADGLDLINNIPIIGREFITITFGFSGDIAPIQTKMVVYRISDRLVDGGGQIQVYKLNLCSPQMMSNRATKLQKSFKGTQDQIVRQVYENHLATKDNPKDLITEKCLYEELFVAPNWSPLKTINHVGSHGIRLRNSGDSTFLFWEGLDKFNYLPMGYLFEQPATWTYARPIANQSDPYTKQESLGKSFFTAEELTINESFNRLHGLRGGAYAATMLTYDPLTRDYRETHYNYSHNFDTMKHLEEFPITPPSKENLSYQQNSVIHYTPTHFQQFDDVASEEHISKTLMSRNAEFLQLMALSMTVTAPGNFIVRAGDVVNMLYKIQKASEHTGVDGERAYDEYLNGKWLVGSIRHRIVGNAEYKIVLSLYKDSVAEGFPDEHEVV